MNRTLEAPTEAELAIKRSILFINTYILLPQILFGCGGNILNLCVLFSKSMRSRTNLIFAMMACSDLAFLVCHLSIFLFYSGIWRNFELFRHNHQKATAAINWFSTVSIWLMTYATVERVQVISSPFKYCSRNINMRFGGTIVSIWIFAFLVSGVHWFCDFANYPLIQKYIVYANALLVVIGPLFLCTWYNAKLVMTLRTNNRDWSALEDNLRYQATMDSRISTERKVTTVVCVIVFCFIVFNCPGAILSIIKTVNGVEKTGSLEFIYWTAVSNALTVTGKVLNFVLFCMSSKNFRNHLRTHFCNFFPYPFNQTTSMRCSTRSFRTQSQSMPLEAV